jgi:hypothetical protein
MGSSASLIFLMKDAWNWSRIEISRRRGRVHFKPAFPVKPSANIVNRRASAVKEKISAADQEDIDHVERI